MASPKTPASREAKIKAKKLRRCRDELRNRLLAPTDIKGLEKDLLTFLKRLPDPLPAKELVAARVAEFLGQRWSVRSHVVEQLIERQTELLSNALWKMDFEDLKAIAHYESKNPAKKRNSRLKKKHA